MINRRSHAGSFRFPRLYAAALACLWIATGATGLRANAVPPRAPQGSLILPAAAASKERGESWPVKNAWAQAGLHLHGESAVRFDLSALKLAPGYYRVGLIARTGTRWTAANDQIDRYRWRLISGSDAPAIPGVFTALGPPEFQPVREAGEPDSWANWYGTIQAPRPLLLRGNEHLEITNRENHGGLIALWVQTAHPLNAAEIELRVDAPHHAFTHGTKPTVQLRLHLPEGLPRLDATLAIEWLDLLTDTAATTRTAVILKPGETRTRTLTPDLRPGVYRVRATVEPAGGERAAVENPSSAQAMLSCSPARLAADLPDDWPLGSHVGANLPPLPGFRWYRYFAQWADVHLAPGRYDWTEFDATFAAVQAAGGRLLIASDGSPTWTSSRGKVGMAWSARATAYPPDDWGVLRDHLGALLARYTDARGTLAALELCNEANTPDRWRGDMPQMLAMARVFSDAAKAARHPVKTIGLSVSAGDHRDYVETLVKTGLLRHVDAVSAHFYEELMSAELTAPINNLPKHVAMLGEPMRAAGHDLPMINTESGIAFARRVNDRPPTQAELNARAQADPQFDPRHPWLLGHSWRPVSERRAAATYVGGFVQLMALGVTQSYVFSQLDLMLDGAPSLPWVALGRLGDALHGVDYSRILPLTARYPGSNGNHGSPRALAYLLGRPGGRQVIIAWGFLSDTRVGRSKHWQRWLDPQPLRVETEIPGGMLVDLYGRNTSALRSTGGVLEFPCGEEPVFIEILPARK